jgi:hypothetical protein
MKFETLYRQNLGSFIKDELVLFILAAISNLKSHIHDSLNDNQISRGYGLESKLFACPNRM